MCVCVSYRPGQGRAASGWPVEGKGEDAERAGGEGNGAPGESRGGREGREKHSCISLHFLVEHFKGMCPRMCPYTYTENYCKSIFLTPLF